MLASPSGGLDSGRIGAICGELAAARRAGRELIVVSSGAVAAGMGMLSLKKRPTSIPELQAVAAAGQGALIEEYSARLREHGLHCAQVLLTYQDMEDRRRYLNARNALEALLRQGVIPIINENDTVTIDELKFGDNDLLSAMVAAKLDADVLLILTTVKGVLSGPPDDRSSQLVERVEKWTPELEQLVHSSRSSHGTGGMTTKLQAARHATRYGSRVVIMDGREPGLLGSAMNGEFSGTLFEPAKNSASARLRWIGLRRPRGIINIDPGAAKALRARKSLLPVGILSVEGRFVEGDPVLLRGEAIDIGIGIANYDRDTIARIAGKKGGELSEVLGEVHYHEVVHCDNLSLHEEA